MGIDYIPYKPQFGLGSALLFSAAGSFGILKSKPGNGSSDWIQVLALVASLWWTILMLSAYYYEGPSSTQFVFCAIWTILVFLSFVNCALNNNGPDIAKETSRLEQINDTLSSTRHRISDDATQLEETMVELALEIEKYSKYNHQNETMTIINAFRHHAESFRLSKAFKDENSGRIFRVVNKNKQPDADGWEILHLLALIQLVVPEQDWPIYFEALDRSFDPACNQFQYQDFIEALTRTPKKGKWFNELFKQIDDDNDGLLDVEELENALNYVMKTYYEGEILSIFENIDHITKLCQALDDEDADDGACDTAHLDRLSDNVFEKLRIYVPNFPKGQGVIFQKEEGNEHPYPKVTPLTAFEDWLEDHREANRLRSSFLIKEPIESSMRDFEEHIESSMKDEDAVLKEIFLLLGDVHKEIFEELKKMDNDGQGAFTGFFPNLRATTAKDERYRYRNCEYIIHAVKSLLKNAQDKLQEGRIRKNVATSWNQTCLQHLVAPNCGCVVQCGCVEVGNAEKCCCSDIDIESDPEHGELIFTTPNYQPLAKNLMNKFDVDGSGNINMDEFDFMMRYLTSTKKYNIDEIMRETQYGGAVAGYRRIVRRVTRQFFEEGTVLCACCGCAIRSGCAGCHFYPPKKK